MLLLISVWSLVIEDIDRMKINYHCLWFKLMLSKISTLTLTFPCASMEPNRTNLMSRVIPWLSINHVVKLTSIYQLSNSISIIPIFSL